MNFLMTLLEHEFYVVEAITDPQHIITTVQQVVPEEARNGITPNFILGLMTRNYRLNPSDKDYPTRSAALMALRDMGLVKIYNGLVQKTAQGSAAAQKLNGYSGTTSTAPASDVKAAVERGAGNKTGELKHYMRQQAQAAYDEYISKAPNNVVDALTNILPELEPEDILFLNKISSLRKEKKNYIDTQVISRLMSDSQMIDRLSVLGFIKPDLSLNVKFSDSFFDAIESVDPAVLRLASPSLFAKIVRISGDRARSTNFVVKSIHPDSENRTVQGSRLWKVLNSSMFTQKVLDSLKKLGVNSPAIVKFGESDKEALISVIKYFKDAESPEALIDAINREFASRQDFKSLNRSGEKVASRRDTLTDFIGKR